MSPVETVEERVSVVETAGSAATVTVTEPDGPVVIEIPADPAVVVTEVVQPRLVEIGISGPQGIPGPPGVPGPVGPADAWRYVHLQNAASAVWTIVHNLNGYPNVTVVDSAGDVVEPDVDYVDANTLTITTSVPFSGTAYLS